MINGNFYDLACECNDAFGVKFPQNVREHIYCSEMITDICKEMSVLTSKPMGRYVSFLFGDLRNYGEEIAAEVIPLISHQINDMMGVGKHKKLLLAGLGNKELAFDALGHLTCSQTEPTERLVVFSSDVPLKSGMESLDAIRGIVKECKCDGVIAVDSLAAKDESMVGRVIQLCDSGICPGSGVGAHSAEISSKTVGVPVLAIGATCALRAGDELYERGYVCVPNFVCNITKQIAQIISSSIKKIDNVKP